MKQIPAVSSKIPLKDNKPTGRVAQCNLKVYDEKYNLVELKE